MLPVFYLAATCMQRSHHRSGQHCYTSTNHLQAAAHPHLIFIIYIDITFSRVCYGSDHPVVVVVLFSPKYIYVSDGGSFWRKPFRRRDIRRFWSCSPRKSQNNQGIERVCVCIPSMNVHLSGRIKGWQSAIGTACPETVDNAESPTLREALLTATERAPYLLFLLYSQYLMCTATLYTKT